MWTVCILFFQATLFAGYAYCACVEQSFPAAHAERRARDSVGCGVSHAAHHSGRILEAGGIRVAGAARDAGLARHGRDSLLRPVVDRAPVAGLVQPHARRAFALSTVRAFQRRFVDRTRVLSLRVRLALYATHPGAVVVRGFVAFAIVCGICGLLLARHKAPATDRAEAAAAGNATGAGHATGAGDATGAGPAPGLRLLWFALAMVPSVLLLATTNQVCLDVASVPFLWVLPLTLYLLSFILCFDNDRWYARRVAMPAAVLAIAAVYPTLWVGKTVPLVMQIIVYFSALFCCAMVCHGELSRLRPQARHLTAFYLLISAGGAAGGSSSRSSHRSSSRVTSSCSWDSWRARS